VAFVLVWPLVRLCRPPSLGRRSGHCLVALLLCVALYGALGVALVCASCLLLACVVGVGDTVFPAATYFFSCSCYANDVSFFLGIHTSRPSLQHTMRALRACVDIPETSLFSDWVGNNVGNRKNLVPLRPVPFPSTIYFPAARAFICFCLRPCLSGGVRPLSGHKHRPVVGQTLGRRSAWPISTLYSRLRFSR